MVTEWMRLMRCLAYGCKQGKLIYDAKGKPEDFENWGQAFDVEADRDAIKEDLRIYAETSRTALHAIGDGVITTDKNGMITGMNRVGTVLTGWEPEEVIGRHFKDVIRMKDEIIEVGSENNLIGVLELCDAERPSRNTMLVRKDGSIASIAHCACPIRDEKDHFLGVVIVIKDTRQEKINIEKIVYLGYHDVLTGLKNRRFVDEALRKINNKKYYPITVVMGDVNGLKLTNDVFGHDSGDIILKKVAKILMKVCRQDDIAARWSGDEFLVFLPRTTAQTASKILEKIQKRLLETEEGSLPISVSFGSATKEDDKRSVSQIIQKAEENMYHQKLLDGHSYRNSLVNILLATLYEKSLETKEHSDRLKIYCHEVGKQFNLSDFDMDNLSLLALLHDIGKVAVDPSVLKKEGSLNDAEWNEMRRHSEIGYRIALNSPDLSSVSNYILAHHEKWDGTGYPKGLKGKEIPLLSRIIAVADAYDAMTNDRIYRKAISQEDALQELMQNAGSQFDPLIVKLFVDSVHV